MRERPTTLTLADLIAGLAGDRIPTALVPDVEIRGAVVDSRLAQPGCLFVALQGELHDGHSFIGDAVARGATAVVAEKLPSGVACTALDVEHGSPDGEPNKLELPLCLLVSDSLAALQRAAAYWRRQHDVRVIGITGSVGKTTSKEAIGAVLGQRYRTLKSEGNYNNEIGLPLTLLHLDATHERVVLEMGMYDLGEISQLADIALPRVGIVTNVGPTHLERLGSIERIAQAKAELPRALPPASAGGVAILNADDHRVRAMAGLTPARVFTYGLASDADLWASHIESKGLEGIRFQFHHRQETIHARVPMLGRHSIHTALCAAAVGLVEGLSWEEILSGLRDQEAQLRLVAVPGPHGSTILDDTYNSSPASCRAALSLLYELDGRKIAVLGDMLELGPYEAEAHRLVGRRARDVVDLLVTVGPLSHTIAEEALRAGMDVGSVYTVETNTQATDLLRTLIEPNVAGDKILVKGSRGMGMEEIVANLQKRDLP
jgi:UDP-N-acetylmuramoyl-tripeptide--D-alanyl-D-alanine ligase